MKQITHGFKDYKKEIEMRFPKDKSPINPELLAIDETAKQNLSCPSIRTWLSRKINEQATKKEIIIWIQKEINSLSKS